MKLILTALLCVLITVSSCAQKNKEAKASEKFAVTKTDTEWKKRIERMGWQEQRFCAANAMLTWDMYLMMAQNPRAYGIV
jgi:hypothetical protein